MLASMATALAAPARPRVRSIDALRAFVMAAMIFVNDVAGAPGGTVPPWMRHFPADGDGMTFVDLVFPAFLFVTLGPFSLRHEWWGILGLIGWAYLVAAVIYLAFHGRPTATLGCMVLLFCLYPAERAGKFGGLWLAEHVGFDSTVGSQAAIAVG